MPDLSLSQKAALRTTLEASLHMLVKTGKHYSPSFVGGARIRHTTVQSLLLVGLLRRVEGSTSVCLTAAGTEAAQALALEHQQAATAATLRRAHKAQLGREAYARKKQREASAATPTANTHPATMRLPYADN